MPGGAASSCTETLASGLVSEPAAAHTVTPCGVAAPERSFVTLREKDRLAKGLSTMAAQSLGPMRILEAYTTAPPVSPLLLLLLWKVGREAEMEVHGVGAGRPRTRLQRMEPGASPITGVSKDMRRVISSVKLVEETPPPLEDGEAMRLLEFITPLESIAKRVYTGL